MTSPAEDRPVGPTWPARRPLTASEQRLRADLRLVVVTDLLAQLALAPLLVIVASGWMWVLWLARPLAVVGCLLALRELRADRLDRAIRYLVTSHVVTGAVTVAALPEAAPLVMLVMFGDLTFGAYRARSALAEHVALCLVGIAVIALLSLSTWSDLADQAPVWLLAGVLGTHGLVTSWVTARTGRETYTLMRNHGTRLRLIAERAREADREGQRHVARELATGTGGDLARLAEEVRDLQHELGTASVGAEAVVAAADRATDRAKDALHRLRVLAHGLSPDVLHQHGLGAAITAADQLVPDGTVTVTVAEQPRRRFDPAVESAFYACVVTAAQHARPGAELSVATRERRGFAELLAVGTGLALDTETLLRMDDRIGAAGGNLDVRYGAVQDEAVRDEAVRDETVHDKTVHDEAVRDEAVLHAWVPLSPALPGPAAAADGATTPILRRFIRSSILLCVAGLVATGGVGILTRLPAVAVVFGVLIVVLTCLIVAQHAESRGRVGLALALLCAETAFAGIVVTLAIPQFAPTTALIVMLPVALGLPYLSPRSLDGIALAQTVMVAAVIVLGVADSGIMPGGDLPQWVQLALLAPTAVAVALLVVIVLAEGRSAVDSANGRLQGALTSLTTAIDATRRTIERDLHDGAQQYLAALAIQLHVVARVADQPDRAVAVLARVAEQIEQARTDLRALVDGSFGEALLDAGLEPALRRSAALAPRPVTVTVEGRHDVLGHVAQAVYFACNEAVQNAVKHAGAEAAISVVVHAGHDRVDFQVSDDGVGCDPATLAAGQGLASLAGRVHEASGAMSVRSVPGHGTALTGWVPVRAVAASP